MSSVVRNPNQLANGPARALPTGTKTSETIQSIEPTRDSLSNGISRCKTVSQTALPKTMPRLNVPFATAITTAGNGGTSASVGSEASNQAQKHASNGRPGRSL
jgi:hypothetical protein